MPKIRLEGNLCLRCRHTWIPRIKVTVRVCPKCKSPYWDTPRKKSSKKKSGE